MSTGRASLVQSLSALDVESVRVPPADLVDAIGESVAGQAVGIADPEWGNPVHDAVTWDPTPAELREAGTGVAPAAFAIADYGSTVLPTAPRPTRSNCWSPTHGGDAQSGACLEIALSPAPSTNSSSRYLGHLRHK